MIGSYSDQGEMDQWYREALPVAVKDLEANPTLSSILSGFGGYETKKYKENRNFVLLNCLPTVHGQRVQEQLDEMGYYEKALNSFDVMHWPTSKLNDLKARIRSDRFDVGLTVFTEFMTAQRLVDAIGRSQVTIYPILSTGKQSDVLVDDGSEKVYVEVGNLFDSQPEIIIERILNEGAAYLGPRITGNRYLQVEIDTANLVFDQDDDIDEAGSIAKLKDEVNYLAVDKLAAQNGLIDIRQAAQIYASLEVYEGSRRLMPDGLGSVVDSFRNGPLRAWAEAADFSKLNEKTMVQSIISLAAKSPLVEFHTKGFYPSKSAEAEMASFSNHVVRHVTEQIASGQIEPGAANIVLVQGYNWMIRTLVVEEAVAQVMEKIGGFIRSSDLPDIYGVGFFSRNPEDGYFVPNGDFKGPGKLAAAVVKSLRMTI